MANLLTPVSQLFYLIRPNEKISVGQSQFQISNNFENPVQ
jgi:hypothetical protein